MQQARDDAAAPQAGSTSVALGTIGLPPPLDPDADKAAWRRWKKMFEAYAVLTKLGSKAKEERKATIVGLLGMNAMDLYDSLPFANDDERSEADKVIKYLDEHFDEERNVIYERFLFYNRQQEKGESFAQYLAALRKHATRCNFDSITPKEILRDRLVSGIQNDSLQQALLAKKTLSLGDCIKMCRTAETSRSQEAMMNSIDEQKTTIKQEDTNYGRANRLQPTSPAKTAISKRETRICMCCGNSHAAGQWMCPAYGDTCKNCGKRNHFARQCKQRKAERTRGRAQQAHFMNNEDCTDDSEDLYGKE